MSKDEMTARERIEAIFNGQEPDRVPLYDIVHNIPIMEHFAGQKITDENAFEVSLRGVGKVCDLTRCIAIPHTGERQNVSSQGFEYNFEWWTFTITKRPYKDVDHLAECIKRDIDEIYDFMAQGRIAPAAQLIAQLTAADAGQPEEIHDAFAKMCEAVGDCVIVQPESIVGLTTAYVRAGWDLFIYLMSDYPDLTSEWLEALCEYEVWRIHHIADPELSPIAMVADDIAGKDGLFFSPEWLRQEHWPRVKRCIDAWHEHGIKVIHHTDGNRMEAIEDILACGPEAINPIEPDVGMSMAEIREHSKDIILTSMIDCDQLLVYGTPEEVEKECRAAIDEAAVGGRFLLGSSSELHPAVKLENVLKMYEVCHTYGHYENKDRWGQSN